MTFRHKNSQIYESQSVYVHFNLNRTHTFQTHCDYFFYHISIFFSSYALYYIFNVKIQTVLNHQNREIKRFYIKYDIIQALPSYLTQNCVYFGTKFDNSLLYLHFFRKRATQRTQFLSESFKYNLKRTQTNFRPDIQKKKQFLPSSTFILKSYLRTL